MFTRFKPHTANPFLIHSILRRAPRVTAYQVEDPRWTLPPLRIAFLSDLHVGAPWVSLGYVSRLVAQINALEADIILMGGDYLLDRNIRFMSRAALAADIVEALSPLRAPLGVHGILGNHDWKDCDLTRETGFQRNSVIEAFAATGQPLLRNSSRHIPHGDTGFWLVGTDSQRIGRDSQRKYKSFLDAEAAFADVPEGAPAIHLAHEPDYFAEADPRAFLQLSGHTHGGQIKLFGRTPVVPSEFGERYVTGYTQESGNHLIVSDGIGFSGPPLRFGVPPEIVLITIGHWE